MHTAIGGGNDECLMDCQYKYVFAGDTDHHGFVSHHSGEWADPVVKKGIGFYNFGLRPPAQAPPQPPARKSLRLGERGFCPGGRALWLGEITDFACLPCLPAPVPTEGGAGRRRKGLRN